MLFLFILYHAPPKSQGGRFSIIVNCQFPRPHFSVGPGHFLVAAAAAGGAAAGVAAGAAAVVVADAGAAAAEEEDQDDDPPDVAAEAGVIRTHSIPSE